MIIFKVGDILVVLDPESEPDLAGFKNKGLCQEHADEDLKRSAGHFIIDEFLRLYTSGHINMTYR